jgi:SAM-dependent methyltransferase
LIIAAEPETAERKWACANTECAYASAGFPAAAGDIPVLVDFEQSVVSRHSDISGPISGSMPGRRLARAKHATLRTLFNSRGPTPENVQRFLTKVRELADRPTVLVIGGATVGYGAQGLYADRSLNLIGMDIYRSEITDLIADGHQLPFADRSIHGVWIQAVLEHVLDPHLVASQIHRVLHARGIVYAETPFMQQVHFGRYDFTRFTLSGHRWLFRGFEEISSGITQGPAATMLWSIRYFFGALFGTYKAGTLVALPFFWLRFFDRLARPAYATDGANGVFFLGRKSDRAIGPKEILSQYRGAF